MVATGITCAADKEARTLTMTFPSGAFDERRAWAMFGEALEVFLGRKHSVTVIEKWIDLEGFGSDGG